MEAGLLAASAAAVWLLSRALTRRVETVSGISRQIAGGAYGVRTHVTGPDEIDALGESFDIMAENAMKDVCQLTNPRRATKKEIIGIFQAAY